MKLQMAAISKTASDIEREKMESTLTLQRSLDDATRAIAASEVILTTYCEIVAADHDIAFV